VEDGRLAGWPDHERPDAHLGTWPGGVARRERGAVDRRHPCGALRDQADHLGLRSADLYEEGRLRASPTVSARIPAFADVPPTTALGTRKKQVTRARRRAGRVMHLFTHTAGTHLRLSTGHPVARCTARRVAWGTAARRGPGPGLGIWATLPRCCSRRGPNVNYSVATDFLGASSSGSGQSLDEFSPTISCAPSHDRNRLRRRPEANPGSPPSTGETRATRCDPARRRIGPVRVRKPALLGGGRRRTGVTRGLLRCRFTPFSPAECLAGPEPAQPAELDGHRMMSPAHVRLTWPRITCPGGTKTWRRSARPDIRRVPFPRVGLPASASPHRDGAGAR